MDDTWRTRILSPPLQTSETQGTGGRLRCRPSDFVVEEIPAYTPDGRRGAHVLLPLTKTGLSSEEAAVALAAHLGIERRAVGMAGHKDRRAITTQWVSTPADAAPGLSNFSHPQIQLGEAHPHGNKLRTGHLRGNRFTLVIRQLRVDPPTAIARATATLAALLADGGLANFYGPQRFGRNGHQLDRGLDALRRGRAGRRGNFIVSAGQAGVFNLYLLHRRDRALWRTVLLGDLLRKRERGGLFECTEPDVDQARLDAEELVHTGPIFGSRMRAPTAGTPSADLEAEVLEVAGIDPTALTRLGRKAMGTRRPAVIHPESVRFEAAPAVPEEDLGPGLRLDFTLPSGSFATRLCAEIMGDAEHPAVLDLPADRS